jgi:hypothetical protein
VGPLPPSAGDSRRPALPPADTCQSTVAALYREPCAPRGPAGHRGGPGRTTYHLNAPLDHPDPQDLPKIEITELTHPLFGRRFPLVSRIPSLRGPDHILVAYRPSMLLRIPLAATSLSPSLPVSRTKLTAQAIQELVTLATQCEVLCPSSPPPSGLASRPNSKPNSKPNLPLSSRR